VADLSTWAGASAVFDERHDLDQAVH
jgi:hypothetical protein